MAKGAHQIAPRVHAKRFAVCGNCGRIVASGEKRTTLVELLIRLANERRTIWEPCNPVAHGHETWFQEEKQESKASANAIEFCTRYTTPVREKETRLRRLALGC